MQRIETRLDELEGHDRDAPAQLPYRILQQQVAYYLFFKYPKAAVIRVDVQRFG